jgi:hypothetical protein
VQLADGFDASMKFQSECNFETILLMSARMVALSSTISIVFGMATSG